jgi:hypothetical protein
LKSCPKRTGKTSCEILVPYRTLVKNFQGPELKGKAGLITKPRRWYSNILKEILGDEFYKDWN